MQPVQNDPVTDIKIVCQKDKFPPGFFIIEKTVQGHDGQLFDSTWRHKGKRYICYSKQAGAHVIVDMSIINDGDSVAQGYTAITNAYDDASEKAFRKHQLCVKMMPKDQVNQAVCDMTLVNKSKGEVPPPGYYAITNDVNDLFICFRMGPIQRYPPPPPPATGPGNYSYSSAPHSVGANRQQWYGQGQGQSMPMPWQPAPQQQQQQQQQQQNAKAFSQYTPHHAMPATKLSAQTGIEGLPFQINNKFDMLWKKSSQNVAGIPKLSSDDIKIQYSYDFIQERKILPS